MSYRPAVCDYQNPWCMQIYNAASKASHRLFVKIEWFEWLGSKGRHGWTKMDTFRFRGKHWGDLGYRSEFYGTHQPCPHSGWTWKGHMGSKKVKNHSEIIKYNIPAIFVTENWCFQKSAKTKMTALPRSIDLNGRWTISFWTTNWNIRIGTNNRFRSSILTSESGLEQACAIWSA